MTGATATSTTFRTADDPSTADAWARVLDRFQAELALDHHESERAAREAWAAPTGLGPLPPELLARAMATLAAQRALIVELELAKDVAARHLSAVRAVEAGASVHPSARPSVYVDREG